MKRLFVIFLCLTVMVFCAMGQVKPLASQQLTGFKELLTNINGTFTLPDGFVELTPPNDDKLPFQYGLKFQDADCEIWFQVNPLKADWQRYEANKQLPNPDSLYIKTATDEALLMSGSKDYINRPIPAYILDRYNADEGRSYLLTLANLPATRHFQYALLIVLNKNHYGNILVTCLTNDKGPAFFKNISQVKYCFRFNN